MIDKTLARRGYALTRTDQRASEPVDPFLQIAYEDASALPPHAEQVLTPVNPRLVELRESYQALGWPVCEHSRWDPGAAMSWLDLLYFRGESPFVWHYRESRRISELKYFTFLTHVLRAGHRDMLERLGEDGLFGCWTYRFTGYPPVSRDLMDAVIELDFLERHLGVKTTTGLRVLDIGAGYGRLAHRAAQALPGLAEYCCVDAIAESTFLSEYYLGFRNVTPPARVVPLPEVPSLPARHFDLAVNIHSFSECTHNAIAWWAEQLCRLEIPRLFLIPNEPAGFLSTERDGSQREYLELLEGAGYRLKFEEPVFADPAVQQLMQIEDRFCLFELAR